MKSLRGRRKRSSVHWVGIAIVGLAVASSQILISTPMVAQAANPIGGRPVEMIVPFAPGGAFDLTCRLLAPFLEKTLKKMTGVDQTVIVVNKPGAAGRIAYLDVYKRGPNAPVFVIMSSSAIPQQVGTRNPGFDVTKFTYLGRTSVDYRAITARKDLPVNSFSELVARSQKQPLLVGTSGFGAGEHQNALLISGILKKELSMNLSFDFVHFKGAGDVMAGLLRGDTEVAINSLPDTAMYVRNNVGKPIVQIVPKRTELLPSVPTLIESGVPEQVSAKISNVIMSKRTFVGSPNMNPALAELFRKAIYEVTHDPEVVEKAKKTNLTIDYTAPSEDLQNSKEALELMQPFKPMFEQMFK